MIPGGRGNVVSFMRHLQRRRETDEQLQAARANYYFARWSHRLRQHWQTSFDRLAEYLVELQAAKKADDEEDSQAVNPSSGASAPPSPLRGEE